MTAKQTDKSNNKKAPKKAAAKKAASTKDKTSKDARKEADQHRASEPDYIQILGAVPHPILVIDHHNKITYANAATELFYQTSLSQLKKTTLEEILPFGCPVLAAIDQVRKKSCSFNEYGINISTPRLRENAIVDVFCGPIGDGQDGILLQFQLRSMAQMIERQLSYRGAARTVNGVAAVLAHEIKNPLSGIRGAAQLLETAVAEDDQMLAQLICQETDRIRDLVDRMEIFGDERPLKIEPVNIHTVLNHVTELARNGFASDITINENYDPSLPLVSGERDQLVQIFLNLIKNAAEAVGDNAPEREGQITFSTSFRPGFRLTLPGTKERVLLPLEITIEDNGPGVREDILPHLFDPFVTSKTKGSGLGLALVAKMISDHGGTIECDSSGTGTSFRILLPMADDQAKPKQAKPEQGKNQRG